MADNVLFRVSNISYDYLGRFRALDDVSLGIDTGERIALLGANGSGKSTLLLALAGLIFPSKGSILFSGRELTEETLRLNEFQRFFRSRVGIVFQNSDIQLFNSTVMDEIEFGLIQLALDRDMIKSRVRKYSTLMGITHLLDRHPHNLSIGEKKRVAIASVLAMEPEVILLDEPTAGLDPRTMRHLIDAISISAQDGRTVITATQDIHIVSEIAKRVIVMGENKRVSRDSESTEVLADSEFLESNNLIHVHTHKHAGVTHLHPHEHPSHDHMH